MAIMKKHSFIHNDFESSVKLPPSEKKKILLWLGIASEVMGQLMKKKTFIHLSWLKDISSLQVSVFLCGESRIRQLNREYRGKDKVTDVLSFPSFDSLRVTRPKQESSRGDIFLGDLAICHQKIQKQSREYKISYMDEFIHLYIHGFIHLLGYDHELSLVEEKLMQDWEEEALKLFSVLKKRRGA
jgi:rRNA maturation RNase YbeY